MCECAFCSNHAVLLPTCVQLVFAVPRSSPAARQCSPPSLPPSRACPRSVRMAHRCAWPCQLCSCAANHHVGAAPPPVLHRQSLRFAITHSAFAAVKCHVFNGHLMHATCAKSCWRALAHTTCTQPQARFQAELLEQLSVNGRWGFAFAACGRCVCHSVWLGRGKVRAPAA